MPRLLRAFADRGDVRRAPDLGTLNHTELTAVALRARGYEPAGLVIGAWPADPGLAERCNREELPRVTGVPLLGAIPAGAGALDRTRFIAAARDGWLLGPDPRPLARDQLP